MVERYRVRVRRKLRTLAEGEKPNPYHPDSGWYVKVPSDYTPTFKVVESKEDGTIMSEADAKEVKEMYDLYYGKAMLVRVDD